MTNISKVKWPAFQRKNIRYFKVSYEKVFNLLSNEGSHETINKLKQQWDFFFFSPLKLAKIKRFSRKQGFLRHLPIFLWECHWCNLWKALWQHLLKLKMYMSQDTGFHFGRFVRNIITCKCDTFQGSYSIHEKLKPSKCPPRGNSSYQKEWDLLRCLGNKFQDRF